MDGELKKNFSLSNLKVFRHACPMGLWRNGFLGKCGAPIPPWEIEWHVCKHNFVWNFVKVHTFWEGHKILRNLNLTFCPMQSQSKVRWRFRKILLPSQNIWTLKTKESRCCLFIRYKIILCFKLNNVFTPYKVNTIDFWNGLQVCFE